jgi:lysophospholipase L1-like esterase
MKRGIKRIFAVLFVVILTFSMILTEFLTDNQTVLAFTDNNSRDPVIVVSLGDSYSSGEGIEPFYGQTKSLEDKVKDEDWLAHRSTKSWPALIEIPNISGKMADYKNQNSSECIWYFKASSGAETRHFKNESQKKTIWKNKIYDDKKHYEYLNPQLDVFNTIDDTVDYVTLTIGGNDVGFADIITMCATGSTYLHFGKSKLPLQKKIDELWDGFDTTRSNIKQTYKDISQASGTQAAIIVAGYPKLLDKKGKGVLISKEEATIVNENVSKFNKEIAKIVDECKSEGLNIYFVDVENKFDGHEAYSREAWINKIKLNNPGDENLVDVQFRDFAGTVASAYSVHPNELGAKAYAECVNNKIKEIENDKPKGAISGKIVKALDRSTAVSNASIEVYKSNNLIKKEISNITGNYTINLPEGNYLVKISAPGYIDFKAYATVSENGNTYMETFLLIEGSESEKGIASGKVVNSLTGRGIAGINLDIKRDWNNMNESDEVIKTAVTDSDGNFSVELPIGNYTVQASKDGYSSSTFNIIVQSGITDNQNGIITPMISSDDYLITLTWGENPRDLDSHVEGTLLSGNPFHVYYSHKSQIDGNVEICKLDYDDTTSYGPEHITLKATNDTPYYYYVYRYAGQGTVASSGAKVTVHQGNNLIADFNVPTDIGGDDYWNVFAIKNGELIIKNTITSSADIMYAR